MAPTASQVNLHANRTLRSARAISLPLLTLICLIGVKLYGLHLTVRFLGKMSCLTHEFIHGLGNPTGKVRNWITYRLKPVDSWWAAKATWSALIKIATLFYSFPFLTFYGTFCSVTLFFAYRLGLSFSVTKIGANRKVRDGDLIWKKDLLFF